MQRQQILTGVIVDEQVTFTLEELCDICGMQQAQIIEMVTYGVVEPYGGKIPEQWQFNPVALRRFRTAMRLQHDLEINLAGVALVLDLLDELNALRTQLNVSGH